MTEPTFQAPEIAPTGDESRYGAQERFDSSGQPVKPWGADEKFDPERAWKLIENLRNENGRLKDRELKPEQKLILDEYEKQQEAAKTEVQKANEELSRWQTEAERWRTASVSSTIKALAATDFEYPDDAVGALDASKYLDAGGVIDEQAIKTDLNALLDARPKWRRGESETQTSRPPRPNTAQGASNGQNSSDPAQQFASIMHAALK